MQPALPLRAVLSTHRGVLKNAIAIARPEGQTDPRGRIDPSRLDAAFNLECQLPTQEQIIGSSWLTSPAVVMKQRVRGQNQTMSKKILFAYVIHNISFSAFAQSVVCGGE